MLKNKFSKSLNWDNYIINIEPSIFSRDLLKSNLNIFWSDVIEKHLKDSQHIMFLFRLQWTNNQIVTIGNLHKLNKEDRDYILNRIIEEMKDKSEYYNESSISSMIFSYGIRDGRAIEKVISNDTQFHLYHHHKLPITLDPLNYGKLLERFGNTYVIQVNPKNIVIITKNEDGNIVKFYKSGELTYIFKDIIQNENIFIRKLGRKEFIFKNNELQLLKISKPSKFINPINKGRKSK